MRLADLDFVDLHLGADYCALTQVTGKPNPWEPGTEFRSELDELKIACESGFREATEPEYTIQWEDVQYRVTMYREARQKDLYVLRKLQIQCRPLEYLGFGRDFIQALLKPDATGLVLVVGGMAKGKSTTAASIAWTRISTIGGIGMAIEDPPETPLSGKAGNGRFVQVWARTRTGGYRNAIKLAMRSGASLMYLGEIRDEATAYEALLVSANGTFSVGTMHAGGIAEAAQRLVGRVDNSSRGGARELAATGIHAIIFQDLVRSTGAGGRVVVTPKHKVLSVDDDPSVKAKILRGDWAGLDEDARRQNEKRAWDK